ncbi:MAG: hypothetical protein B7733_13370 [Myxococcales bacterium FL481]|nr:MAG: hypothetical protein B7733_13370 [Myxococcales bacterium FL481]
MLAVSVAFTLQSAPSVGIDVDRLALGELDDADVDQLYAGIVVRLLEGGHSIRAVDQAGVRLILDADDGGYEVEAKTVGAEGSRWRTRQAPKAVELLELQHLALAAVGSQVAEAPSEDAEDGVTVTLEFDDTVSAREIARLQGRVVKVLVRGELVVVPNGRASDWRLCVGVDGEQQLRSFVVPGHARCSDPSPSPARTGRDGLELHAIDMWTELDGGEDPVAIGAVHDEPVNLEPEDAHGWRVGGDVGALARLGGWTSQIGVTARGHWWHGFGAAASGWFAPGRGENLRVLDSYLMAGPAWARQLSPRAEFGWALLAGVALHRAQFTGERRVVRAYFAAGLDLRFSWRVSTRWAVTAAGQLGGAEQGAGHHLAATGEPLWRRGPVRAGISVGAELQWGGQP